MAALYSHTNRGAGTTLTASIYNSDHQNHIDNGVPLQQDDYSANVAQMQVVTDPGEVGTESLATSQAGEFERIRQIIKKITGEPQWYVSPLNPISAWEGSLLINGAQNVAQRGVSIADVGASATQYTLDRFLVYTAGTPQAHAAVTQEDGVFPGFGFSAKIDCTVAEAAVAAGELWSYQTRIEAQDLQHLQYGSADASPITLKFTIKSPKTGIHCVSAHQPDGTRSFIREFTVVAANTAETFTTTFPGDTSGTITNNNGEGLRITWPLVAGGDFQVAADAWAAGEDYATSNQQNLLDNTANNFEITGISLVLGTVAPRDFIHRPYGTELVLAKRYFERLAENIYGAGMNNSTITSLIRLSWTEKRAVPTLAISAAADFRCIDVDGAATDVTGMTFTLIGPKGARAAPTGISNMIDGGGTLLEDDGGGNSFIDVNAEL